MRFPRISVVGIMLGASALGIATIAGFWVMRAVEPDKVAFSSLAVVNPKVTTEELLNVVAQTPRNDIGECVNGVQVELRDDIGSVIRLPIPAREMEGDVSRYSIVIPKNTIPGLYEMKVREVFTCSDGVEIVEAPWVPVEVVSGPAT